MMGFWRIQIVKKDEQGDVPINSDDLEEIAELVREGYKGGIVIEERRD